MVDSSSDDDLLTADIHCWRRRCGYRSRDIRDSLPSSAVGLSGNITIGVCQKWRDALWLVIRVGFPLNAAEDKECTILHGGYCVGSLGPWPRFELLPSLLAPRRGEIEAPKVFE
jgi:hypothetical protein